MSRERRGVDVCIKDYTEEKAWAKSSIEITIIDRIRISY